MANVSLACHRVAWSSDLGHAADDAAAWDAACARGDTRTVFQQLAWQRCWWQAYGRGRLLVVRVDADDRTVAIAPLFVDGAMAFFVGSGGSDYLDFVGDIGAPGVLRAILATVIEQVPDLIGFRLYHVPDASRSGGHLRQAAAELGLSCVDEGGMAAPRLELGTDGSSGRQAARKTSLLRHERACAADGPIVVHHRRRSGDILPRLDAFFDQHRRRWRATAWPSLFENAVHCDFYRRLARVADDVPWLRFTEVALAGRPIAFHMGFCTEGSYLWYKPSFEIDLARKSPGEVLLRHLLLAAVDEGAATFDLGLGDEAFKQRFANATRTVRTWGLYREGVR